MSNYVAISAEKFDKLLYWLSNLPTKVLNGCPIESDDLIYDYKPNEEGSKIDKRLWKCKFIRSFSILPLEETYTDVRELTIDEAVNWHKNLVNWHKNLVKQVNDNSSTTFTSYDGGLFYKKDNEWVYYEND